MRGYTRFGLLLLVLGAGAFLSAGVRARADEEKAGAAENPEKKVEKKVVKVRNGPHHFALGGHFGPGGGVLGVGIEDVGKDDVASLKLTEERGALVTRVEPDSAAAAAGIAEKDVILGFAGERVRSAAQLRRLVAETPAGRTVSLEVSHDGVTKTVQATLGEGSGGPWAAAMPALEALDDFEIEVPELVEPPEALVAPAPPRPGARVKEFRFRVPEPKSLMWRGETFGTRIPRKLGIEYQPVRGQLAKYFKLADNEGVLVTSVTEKGPAGAAGVQAGDIILKVDGKAINDGADLKEALATVDPGEEVALTVQRDGKPLDLKVRAGGQPEKADRPSIST